MCGYSKEKSNREYWLRFWVFVQYMPIKPGVNTFCEISRNPLVIILPNFQGFWGVPIWLRIRQTLVIWRRGFEGGVGNKKVWPPISPPLGGGKSQIYFFLGSAYRGYLVAKTYQPIPTGAPAKIRDCFKKFGGGGTCTRGFEGVAVVRMSHKFIKGFSTKNAQMTFLLFGISTQGVNYTPQKWSNFWRYLTIYAKSRERQMRGHRAHNVSR